MPEGPHPRVTHNTPFRAGKGYLYEGGLRVPLIVRGPGIAGGTRRRGAGRQHRLAADAPRVSAGAPAAAESRRRQPGARCCARGRPASAARTFFWHIPHYTNQGSRPAGAVRDGTLEARRALRRREGRSCSISTRTSSESRDLSKAEPGRTAALRRRLREWRASVGAQENTPNPGVDVRLYEQIYVEFDSTRFDPLRADEAAWRAAATWRERMNAAIKPPVK